MATHAAARNPIARAFAFVVRASLALLPSRSRRRALPAPSIKSVTPQDTTAPLSTTQPQWQDYDEQATIDAALADSTWAYAAIYKNSKAAALVPWTVERRNTSGELEAVESHALVDLMAKPNELGGWLTFVLRGLIHYQQSGNALWAITRYPDGSPSELWELTPGKVRPIEAKEGESIWRAYRYTRTDGSYMDLAPEDVLHLQNPDPANVHWGLSPLKPSGKAIDTDIASAEAQKSGVDNNFMVPAIISPKEGKTISRTKARADKTVFEDRHVGPTKGGKILWMSQPYQVEFLSQTPKDVSFIEGRKMAREEIVAIHGTPPPLVGILENANYSNAREMRRTWWEETLLGMLEIFRDFLQMQLVDREWPDEGLIINYDTSGVLALQTDFGERLTQASALAALGVQLSEINRRLNLGLDPQAVAAAEAAGANAQ
jgi:HK97 family phage portal protein